MRRTNRQLPNIQNDCARAVEHGRDALAMHPCCASVQRKVNSMLQAAGLRMPHAGESDFTARARGAACGRRFQGWTVSAGTAPVLQDV